MYTLNNTSNYTYILHLIHITNIHTKYVTHSTYQSHASQIHLCYIHNPKAPSLITFPLSKWVGLQPRAEKGRVVVNTDHAVLGAGGLGAGCVPQGPRWERETAPGERTCVLCARVHAARGRCAPRLGMCVCVCTRAKGAARGARLCVCENPAPTSAGSSALGVRAGGSSACTALRGVWKCVSAGVCVWDACVEAGVRVNTEPPRRLCS